MYEKNKCMNLNNGDNNQKKNSHSNNEYQHNPKLTHNSQRALQWISVLIVKIIEIHTKVIMMVTFVSRENKKLYCFNVFKCDDCCVYVCVESK